MNIQYTYIALQVEKEDDDVDDGKNSGYVCMGKRKGVGYTLVKHVS